MTKNKLAMFAAIALSAAGLSLTAANAADTSTTVDSGEVKQAKSFGKDCGPGGCRGGKGGGFVKELGLTDAQLEKMNSLKIEFANSTGPRKAELMKLHRELRDDMTKPGVSKSQLLTLQSKINEIRDELSNSKISFMADRMAVLTDDQKAKIRSFSLKHGMGGHGGKHFRGGKHFHGGRPHFGGERPSASTAPNQV